MKTNNLIYHRLLACCLLCAMTLAASAQMSRMGNAMRRTDDAFFRTAEARRVGDALLLYQRVTGGWPKNIDMTKPLTDAERAQLKQDKERRDDSTIDNGATSTQLQFLARLYRQTHADRYRSAFRRGVMARAIWNPKSQPAKNSGVRSVLWGVEPGEHWTSETPSAVKKPVMNLWSEGRVAGFMRQPSSFPDQPQSGVPVRSRLWSGR